MSKWHFEFPEEKVRALLILSDIPINRLHRLENKYWPDAYVEERQCSPWWLAETPYGAIEIGWRKRVINIDWEGTSLRKVITEDDTTKADDMVHAWSYAKAVEYLYILHMELYRLANTQP